MSKVTVHKSLSTKTVAPDPDWPGFREELMTDGDYIALVAQTKAPTLAARLESLAMMDTDNWPLVIQLWNQIKGELTFSSEAPNKWGAMAQKYNIPLTWDASGNMGAAD